MNFHGTAELVLSNYNIFIGKNGTGKSNMAKAIYRLSSELISQQFSPLIPFRGDQETESSIEVVVDFDKSDLDSLRSSPNFKSLYSSNNFTSIPLIVNFSKLDGLTIERRKIRKQNLLKIRNFPEPTNSQQQIQYNTLGQYIAVELRKKTIFIPDTRDLPNSFNFDRTFKDNPITMSNFLTFLTDMKLNHRESYDQLVEMYKRTVPYVKDLNIDPANNELALVEDVDEFRIPTSEISKGTRELIVVLTALAISPKGSSIFLEEPEIHLHPTAIKELISIIRERVKSKDLQVTITTHSRHFLTGLEPALDKEVKVYLFNREPNGESTIKPIITDSDFKEAIDSIN